MASTLQDPVVPTREAAAPRSPRREVAFGSTDLLLVLMALIWGVNFSVVKYGTGALAPLTFNGIRVALATVVLAAIALARPGRRPARRDVLRLLGLGVIGNGLYQLCFIEGVARTRAGAAALVLASTPAFIALIGRLRGSERVTSRGWAGIGLQLLGMACVVLGAAGTAAAAGSSAMLGNALVLGGALCWSVFTVLLKPYTERVDGMHLSAITMLGGAVPIVLVALPGVPGTDWGALAPSVWGALAYSGVMALVVAYLLWYRGVRVLGPTRTAMYSNLQPLIALVVAWLVLSEAPTAWQLVGAASIMSGLLLSRT
jgi:drug/metabolite transporter (DMT)-like permease